MAFMRWERLAPHIYLWFDQETKDGTVSLALATQLALLSHPSMGVKLSYRKGFNILVLVSQLGDMEEAGYPSRRQPIEPLERVWLSLAGKLMRLRWYMVTGSWAVADAVAKRPDAYFSPALAKGLRAHRKVLNCLQK